MLAHRLIERKRDGGKLDGGEWRALIMAYAAGHVPDYQMSAFLMACFLKGLDRAETAALTDAMLNSGVRFDLSALGKPRLDKHSIGGVGDKVSLVLAPLVSCLGIAVPMVSGRGLGHTGGTLDKLESIPGFRTDLTIAEAREQLDGIGCAMMGQTAEIAPADKKMYALRDATATVESIPLIASSIMSKKLAEDLTGLVIDIKRGSGAFLTSFEQEVALATEMIEIGQSHGCPVTALFTAMDRPLGRACGNALEVEEAIATLNGEGPEDLVEVTMALSAEMLLMAGIASDRESAQATLRDALSSGRAADQFRRIVERQGGEPRVLDDASLLPQARECELYTAPRRGFVKCVEPRAVGRGIIGLGGGRTTMADVIDPAVGFVITAKPGDAVETGEPLASIYARDRAGIERGKATLRAAIAIADEAEPPLPLISHRVTKSGVEQLS
ncbi:MAG TPA: thymidine phosphorylase [Gemmatimonadaceae bacterium]|nr:thymidine phosphorylase [Gemmatimonadaceae bacterium]